MSLDNAYEAAIESGEIEGLDVVKVEDLRKTIQPMGKKELDDFIPKFIVQMAENNQMEPQFIYKLINEIIEKQIQLGEFSKSEKARKAEDLKNIIYDHMTTNNATRVFMLSEAVDDLPLDTDFVIPSDYRVSKLRGIVKLNYKKTPTEIYPNIILPVQYINYKDASNEGRLVRIAVWDQTLSKWKYIPSPIQLGDLLKTEKINTLDNIGGTAIGSKYNKGLAEFMVDLFHANKMLENLTLNEAVQECGWTSEKLFFPFTTKDKGEHLLFTGKQNSPVTSVYNASRNLPRGNKGKAFEVLEELKENDVFGVVLAGCLASPLLPFLKGMLDENIGIDVYGETSSGKTTIEVIAVDLIYGLNVATKLQWKDATAAGIWGGVEQLTNLPVILYETHQMEEKLYSIPHGLINRKRGIKNQQSSDGTWSPTDTTKEQYCGTLLFNGEVSISSKNPDDSAGIHGRIISINKSPFPDHYNSDMVEELKIKVSSSGGHFAEPWIRFIAELDIDETIIRINEIKKLFQKDGSEKLYQRATAKAATLVYCLQEFNKLFNTSINISRLTFRTLNRRLRTDFLEEMCYGTGSSDGRIAQPSRCPTDSFSRDRSIHRSPDRPTHASLPCSRALRTVGLGYRQAIEIRQPSCT